MQELTDIQASQDQRNIPIDRVGVKELRYPLSIADKDGKNQNTVAKVSLAVDLPHHYKGTHMSRFVEALHSHGNCITVNTMAHLPELLLERLDACKAHVSFTFPFFCEKEAPISKKKGLVDYEICFECEADNQGNNDSIVTVKVPVATLCPCSKAISDRGAHNQRGIVTYSVRCKEPIWIEDLIRVVENSASCELYSVLKRTDEKEVTEHAYDHPVFVEDLVRNVAARSNEEDNIIWYRVEAENHESIHNHNAYAIIEKKREHKNTAKV